MPAHIAHPSPHLPSHHRGRACDRTHSSSSLGSPGLGILHTPLSSRSHSESEPNSDQSKATRYFGLALTPTRDAFRVFMVSHLAIHSHLGRLGILSLPHVERPARLDHLAMVTRRVVPWFSIVACFVTHASSKLHLLPLALRQWLFSTNVTHTHFPMISRFGLCVVAFWSPVVTLISPLLRACL